MEDTASDKEFIEFLDVLLRRFVILSVLVPIVHETSTKRWWHILRL